MKNLTYWSIIAIGLLFSCKNAKQEATGTDTYAVSASSEACLADPAWFMTDPATGKRKTSAPEEGKSSVFGNNATVSNCDFHQWSWQKFLWLTNDISGKPLFLDRFIQVNPQTVPVAGSADKVILATADQNQATGNVLKTNSTYNANDSSYTVYYSIHVDSSLYNSIQKFAPMNPDDYKDSTFAVGSLELKIAWVNKEALRDTSNYFITSGSIEGADVRIALLGMHVVGVVYNHPEFVWATFEHQDMVPYYDWAATTTSDVPVTSGTNYLFFDSTATGTLANIELSSDSTNVFAVNRYGVPRKAGNGFLVTSQSEPENYNNIDSINASVHSQLTDVWNNYFYNGSIWVNTEGYDYPTQQAQLLDSLGNTLGYAAQDTLLRGSIAAYNITMETYEQLGFSPTSIHGQSVSNLGNCFQCHSASRGSALNVSHIFNGAVDNTKGLTRFETKQKHLDEITTFIKQMK